MVLKKWNFVCTHFSVVYVFAFLFVFKEAVCVLPLTPHPPPSLPPNAKAHLRNLRRVVVVVVVVVGGYKERG